MAIVISSSMPSLANYDRDAWHVPCETSLNTVGSVGSIGTSWGNPTTRRGWPRALPT